MSVSSLLVPGSGVGVSSGSDVARGRMLLRDDAGCVSDDGVSSVGSGDIPSDRNLSPGVGIVSLMDFGVAEIVFNEFQVGRVVECGVLRNVVFLGLLG